MRVYLKYSLLFLLSFIYLLHGIQAMHYTGNEWNEERTIPEEERTFRQAAIFTEEALPASVLHDGNNTQPTFRYLSKSAHSLLIYEHQRELTPNYHRVKTTYLQAFALKQDVGYYVFALRKIIV